MDTQLIVLPTVNGTKKSADLKHSPFSSYSEVLAQAERLFQVRELWQDAVKNDRNEVVIERKEKRYRKLRAVWHTRCKISELPLCRQDVELGLTDLERELLWGVLSLHVGEGKSTHNNHEIIELFTHISIERSDRLSAIKLLDPDAPLFKQKLVFANDDSDGDPLKNEIFPELELLQEILGAKPNPQNYWVLQEEHELYSALRKLFRLLESNADDFRIYLEAQRKKAVLFWDEADAMLYDRDDASRNWEVRDVNVILQEIERFEGVCILATNRRQNLDKALARRISMQVEFPRPQTAVERLRIWQAILPPKLPLASDVDLELLAHEDLSGGEIKNVLLNAARFAAARGETDAMLTFADFDQAVRWELRVRQERAKPVGF